MIKQYFKQAIVQLRQQPVISAITIVGTALAIFLIMLVVMIQQVKVAPFSPESNRDRFLHVYDITVNIKPILKHDSVMMSRSQDYIKQIYSLISHYPGVEEACYYYGSIPYTNNIMSEGYAPHSDSTHVYHNTPFYRKKMQELGVTPDDINSIDDIVKLPFTTKLDLRDNYPFGLCAVPMSQIVRIHGKADSKSEPRLLICL